MSELVYVDSGTGIAVVVDEVAGGAVQYIKLMAGTEDSTAKIGGDATYGLDVDVSRIQAPIFVTGGTIAVTGGSITANLNAGGTLTSTIIGADRALDVNVVATTSTGFQLVTITGNNTDFATNTSILAISSLLATISGHVDGIETLLAGVIDVNANMQINDTDVSATNPVFIYPSGGSLPVTVDNLTFSGGINYGDTIINALTASAYDLSAAVYSGTTNVANDYKLSRAGMHFSTTEARNVLFKTDTNVILYSEIGFTGYSLTIDFEDIAFDSGNDVIAYVSQTSGPCNMDFTLVAKENVIAGGNSLNVTGEISYGNVLNGLTESLYDLQAMAYSGETNITSGYRLGKLEMNFSSADPRNITVTTNRGTRIFQDLGNVSSHLFIDFEGVPFAANDDISIQVSQTSSSCNMNLALTALALN